MKITLDTENKTITLHEKVNLDVFIDGIKQLLPRDAIKEFELIPHVVDNTISTDPIPNPWITPGIHPYQPFVPYTPYNDRWWDQPWVTTSEITLDKQNVEFLPGVYNIDIQEMD